MKRMIRQLFGGAAIALLAATLAGPTAAKDGGGDPKPNPQPDPAPSAEVTGVVQAMPPSGLVGAWKIAGRAVTSTATTRVDQENGQIGVGAVVEASGAPQPDGSLLAAKMEVKRGVEAPPPVPGTGPGTPGKPGDDEADSGEVKGAIVALPAGGLIGTWAVAGRQVIVVSTTRIDQERGAIAVGAIVEVSGLPDDTGAIVASKIEVDSGGPGSTPGEKTPVPDKVDVEGLIEALPATGLVGNWQVGGKTVIVADTTVLDAGHGAFVVGASVEARGALDTNGALVAAKVETTEGNGAPVPPLEFRGRIVELPTGTTGLIGVWKVDDKLVNVTAETKIEAAAAALVVGATVEVHGWPQPDGMIEAKEIEALPAAAAAATTKAVEFFNPALGHFFMTALPNEIAALDAGGKWLRTGQSFTVGAGSGGVCRFYGMPPKGPDSHFFTVDPAECQFVMTQFAAWTFEGYAFNVTPPVNGSCPANTVAVQRFFNNPTTAAAINHRFTATAEAAAQTLAMGWTPEGVVMCAQP